MHSLELKDAAAEREQAETAHVLSPPRESAILNIPLIPVAELEQGSSNSQNCSTMQEEQHFWDALDPSSEVFEMDESPEVALEQKRQEFENKLDDYGVWEGNESIMDGDVAAALELAWDESEQDEVLSEILKHLNLGTRIHTLMARGLITFELLDHDVPKDLQNSHDEWFPYPSKLVFLLDTIDNLPRL